MKNHSELSKKKPRFQNHASDNSEDRESDSTSIGCSRTLISEVEISLVDSQHEKRNTIRARRRPDFA